jgi:Xaa-Pro aminopeptidase
MFEPAVYASRRETLIRDLPEEYAVVVPPASTKPSSADGSYPYIPSKNLVYLTGIEQEDTWLVMYRRKGEEAKEVLFISPYSEEYAKWFGTVLTKEQATEKSLIEDVRFSDASGKWIDRLLQRFGIPNVFIDFPLGSVRSEGGERLRFANRIRTAYPQVKFERLSSRIFSSRMIKSDEELRIMASTIDLTDRGFRRACEALHPGMIEYEFRAEILYEFSRVGQTEAFPAIVAGGKMATCLHYVDNNKVLEDGDLLLVDFGAQTGLYNTDITRTVPVNGRYTERQRELMEMVLTVQAEAIRLLRPGKLHLQWNSEVNEFYGKLMKEMGLIVEEKDFSQFYYHNIGHHLGMDTHDECIIATEFRPGMVLTVEPGFYSAEEGIGIRIEDDVLIGEDCNTILSAQIPKTPDEIEALMADSG